MTGAKPKVSYSIPQSGNAPVKGEQVCSGPREAVRLMKFLK